MGKLLTQELRIHGRARGNIPDPAPGIRTISFMTRYAPGNRNLHAITRTGS